MPTDGLVIQSLDEYQVQIEPAVKDYLSESLKGLHNHDIEAARDHFDRMLRAMKTAPAASICRVNQIGSTREQAVEDLEKEVISWKSRHSRNDISSTHDADTPIIVVRPHPGLSDVVCVGVVAPSVCNSLANCRIPPVAENSTLFKSWPSRALMGWPMSHHVVICDRFCGEAVLRGSDIFVRGVISADTGIQAGDQVAVYADIRDNGQKLLTRGLMLLNYTGRCIFLGLGTACCSRTEMLTLAKGVAVEMSCNPKERAGPVLPPFSGVLSGKMMMQNIPSILVGHALDPQPNDVIIDLCAAPGGKASHLASIVRNQATIVACDKSRQKMVTAREVFHEMGITCITPLAWNSANCVIRDGSIRKSVHEIIATSPISEKDSLLSVGGFYPESFDRVLLDPPCSALGLRPKLFLSDATLKELKRLVLYQRQFVSEAVSLLKPGGSMTYSTCTIHYLENEGMVQHVLNTYPEMQLVDVGINIGLPGLPAVGLTESERLLVRRFDPSDDTDTMGFFLAKFVKKQR